MQKTDRNDVILIFFFVIKTSDVIHISFIPLLHFSLWHFIICEMNGKFSNCRAGKSMIRVFTWQSVSRAVVNRYWVCVLFPMIQFIVELKSFHYYFLFLVLDTWCNRLNGAISIDLLLFLIIMRLERSKVDCI